MQRDKVKTGDPLSFFILFYTHPGLCPSFAPFRILPYWVHCVVRQILLTECNCIYEVKIMEQAKKHLKVSSLIVLLFAALTLLQIVTELFFGDLKSAVIPDGAPENILMITQIVIMVVSLLLLLPSIYVGVKGLRIAKNPSSGKAHIVWACIILAVSVSGLIDPVVAIIKQGGGFENFSSLFSIILDVVIYYDYIKYAREIAKLAD